MLNPSYEKPNECLGELHKMSLVIQYWQQTTKQTSEMTKNIFHSQTKD